MRSSWLLILPVLAGAVLGSCRKPQAPEEEISVSPIGISASAQMKSYKVEVSSNTSWTVKEERELSWVVLDRSSGHDNATMSVRVLENKYKDAREARIVFSTKGGKQAFVDLSQEGTEEGEEKPPVNKFRIGSYNLRMSGLDKEGDNVWSKRKGRLKESLLACDFDVFGIQEVSSETQAWLDAELSSKYTFRYFSPYSQQGNGDRAQGIGFRKGAFTLSDWHFFWASSSPDSMSENDTGTQGNYKRGACCCILTHKESGIKLFFMNNHGCLNSESNKANAIYYEPQEKRFNPEGLPSFFAGDMNARESSDEGSPYKVYTSYWKDPYRELDAAFRKGCEGTYNGFAYPSGRYRIDYVFFRGEGVTPTLYNCDNTLYGGLYASDHFPLWVEYEIEK